MIEKLQPAEIEPIEKETVGLQINALAYMPGKTILDEKRLAAILRVSTRTVRRMIARNELPPPARLSGRSVWLADHLLAHIERCAQNAARNAEREKARIAKHFS